MLPLMETINATSPHACEVRRSSPIASELRRHENQLNEHTSKHTSINSGPTRAYGDNKRDSWLQSRGRPTCETDLRIEVRQLGGHWGLLIGWTGRVLDATITLIAESRLLFPWRAF